MNDLELWAALAVVVAFILLGWQDLLNILMRRSEAKRTAVKRKLLVGLDRYLDAHKATPPSSGSHPDDCNCVACDGEHEQ